MNIISTSHSSGRVARLEEHVAEVPNNNNNDNANNTNDTTTTTNNNNNN